MGQRPVRAPRERRLRAGWLVAGGVALVAIGAGGLVLLTATGVALPATALVLVLLVPAGVAALARGLARLRDERGGMGAGSASDGVEGDAGSGGARAP